MIGPNIIPIVPIIKLNLGVARVSAILAIFDKLSDIAKLSVSIEKKREAIMQCEKCGSSNLIRKGTTKTVKGSGRTIWKCKDCDRYTTEGKQKPKTPKKKKPPTKEQVARWRKANPEKRQAQIERQKARQREKYQKRKSA